MSNFKFEPGPGDHFDAVANKAKLISQTRGIPVEFEFNGVTCVVDVNTNLAWLYRDYCNSWTMGWKIVGPNCAEKYDDATAEEFTRRKAVEKEKAEQQRKEWARRDA